MSVEARDRRQPFPDQPRPGQEAPVTVIEATRGWGNLGLGQVWAYRELLWYLTMRDIKARYRQMALGPLWIIITPIVSMVIFTLIFGGLAKLPSDGVPYPIFTYVAILPWTYFSKAVTGSAASLRSGMGVISKVYFPRAIMPISGVIGGLADFGMGTLVLLGLLAYFRMMPAVASVFLPLYLLLAMVTALGLGLWVSAIQVRFRDIGNLVTYGLQTWMYLTPVAYAASLIPDRFQLVYQLNPMYWVIEGFRWGLIGTGSGPQPLMLVPVGAVALMLVSGAYIFRRTERTVVDLL